jgi:hypothetical protein
MVVIVNSTQKCGNKRSAPIWQVDPTFPFMNTITSIFIGKCYLYG